MKVTVLKTFIYADDIMVWGDDMEELHIRLAHGLQINLWETVMLRLSRKEERN
jgi:hypothetical protein